MDGEGGTLVPWLCEFDRSCARKSSDMATRESELRTKLRQAFARKNLTNAKAPHTDFGSALASYTNGNLKVMSYTTFNKWISGNRNTQNGLSLPFRNAIETYIGLVHSTPSNVADLKLAAV